MLESKPETLQKDVGKQTLKRMSVEIPSGLSVATGALRTSVHKCGGQTPHYARKASILTTTYNRKSGTYNPTYQVP